MEGKIQTSADSLEKRQQAESLVICTAAEYMETLLVKLSRSWKLRGRGAEREIASHEGGGSSWECLPFP